MMLCNIVNVLNATEVYVQNFKMVCFCTSLVVMVQWLRIHISVQGT